MVFQDPYQSLNPRNRIIDLVAEPLDVNHLVHSPEERLEKVKQALEQAGLSPAEEYLYRYPYELSGGQRQACGHRRGDHHGTKVRGGR